LAKFIDARIVHDRARVVAENGGGGKRNCGGLDLNQDTQRFSASFQFGKSFSLTHLPAP
jgi:hypothetical protein